MNLFDPFHLKTAEQPERAANADDERFMALEGFESIMRLVL